MTFFRRNDGGVSILTVIMLPLLLFAAGLAVDLTALDNQKQYVQGQADLGALSAATNFGSPGELRRAARRTVAQNRAYWVAPLDDADIELGTLANRNFTPLANQNSMDGATAVRVTVTSPVNMYILSMFADDSAAVVSRSAVAVVDPRVSFGLSNCLLNARLLAPVLRPIIGASVDVLCSGRGIDTQIDAAEFLGGLRLRASALTPSGRMDTYGDILDAEYAASEVMSQALGLVALPNSAPIRLGDVLLLSEDLRRTRIGAPIPPMSLRAADVVLASAAILQERIVDAEVGVNLGSFGNVALKVQVSDPPRIVIGMRPGDPGAVARTAQIRVEVPALNIANIFSLKLNVEVAHASARLTARGQTCSRDPAATVAVFDPVTAGLLHVAAEVKVLGLPLNLDTAATKIAQVVEGIRGSESFTYRQYIDREPRQFGPTTPQMINALTAQLRGATSGLLSDARAAISGAGTGGSGCTGLGCLVNAAVSSALAVVNGVLGVLNTTIPNVSSGTGVAGEAVDDLLGDLLDLRIANAELRLLDVDCREGVRLGL